jgi:hypothetical protein
MRKLIVAFSNFANTPKNCQVILNLRKECNFIILIIFLNIKLSINLRTETAINKLVCCLMCCLCECVCVCVCVCVCSCNLRPIVFVPVLQLADVLLN